MEIQIVWGPLPNGLVDRQNSYSVHDLFNEKGHFNPEQIVEDNSGKDTFLIAHEDYGFVKEFVYEFLPHIIYYLDHEDSINQCLIQNPPKLLLDSMNRSFKEINHTSYKYNHIDDDVFVDIERNLKEKILGQEKALDELLSTLYIRKAGISNKPLVILLYGQAGVGKTETAKIISEQVDQHTMFRKQFSMFQTGEFGNYLFGSSENQNSFARDLLMRKSNILLLDEFDKCPSLFHSAFYQLFDEGIYTDKNYEVHMENSIIICTSNYRNKDEISAILGGPIYSRFDAIIEYAPLSVEIKKLLIKQSYEKNLGQFSDDDQEVIKNFNLLDQLVSMADRFQNVREIDKFILLLMANKCMKNFLSNSMSL